MLLVLILLLVAPAAVLSAPTPPPTCGYESCPASNPGVLNVHIVPHTHDDVGWLKTVDQYYYGSKNDIQKAGVQYILDSVISELWKDKSRRFIYVETAFFWKWWLRQHEDIRDKVHALVREGRLEFIGGAWSMNDEADTHYQSTIDQFTWGLRKLNDTFGECGRPRVAWQIDPFGHSREFASLLADMGYDGLFHGRIDYQDKLARKKNRSMEMIWRGNDDLGHASDLFTGVLYNTYSPPAGFCFDILCQDEPIVDDVDSPIYNVDKKIGTFIEIARNISLSYRTNNVLITMGEDFNYQDALMWFTNLDLLIKYGNLKANQDKKDIRLFYSTPSCYLKAVHDAKPALPTKQDDFFPYASDPHSYWTGYFTSRPTVKYFERRGNSYLQMVKQLQVIANLEDHNRFLIDELRSAMGIMQHHDAVTGTEKQHVANDYSRLLDLAIEDSLKVAEQAFSKMMERDPLDVTRLDLMRCQFNISQCGPSETSEQFFVTLYNPVGWSVEAVVRLPVSYKHYTVYGSKGEIVESQLIEIPKALAKVPTRHSVTNNELVFTHQLPGLAFTSFYVRHVVVVSERLGLKTKDKMAANTLGRGKTKNFKKHPHIRSARLNVQTYEDYELLEPLGIEQTTRQDDESPIDKISSNERLKMMIIQEEHLRRLEKMEPDAIAERNEIAEAEEEDEFERVHKHKDVSMPMSAIYDRMMSDPRVVQVYAEDEFIENEHLKLSINKETGKYTLLRLKDGPEISFDIDMMYYPAWIGDNEIAENRSSGAYIFRPNGTKAIPMDLGNRTKIIKGPIVQEIHHEYDNFGSSITRLYRNSKMLEFEWLVGPIPIKDNIGKEVIVRYSTNLNNGNVFYTDSNGKQGLKRVLNQRPQYNATILEPIAGNYYPVNSKIHIEDLNTKLRFSVLTDRAQGGSSLDVGEIELMVHRRLLHDDAFGVGEALNEIAQGEGLVARGKHYISIGKIDAEIKKYEKKTAVEIVQPVEILVSNNSKISIDDWRWFKNEWSAISRNLPDGLHLLTLEPWRHNTLLLRLENIYEKIDLTGNENTLKDFAVDLSTLFTTFTPTSINETTLAANQWWDDMDRMEWTTDEKFNNLHKNYQTEGKVKKRQAVANYVITVRPSEIRTFVITYNPKAAFIKKQRNKKIVALKKSISDDMSYVMESNNVNAVTESKDDGDVTESNDNNALTENKDDNAELESKDDATVEENKNDKTVTESMDDNAVTENKDDNAESESKNDNAVTESSNDNDVTDSTDNDAVTEKKDDIVATESKDDDIVTESKDDDAVTESKDDDVVRESKEDNTEIDVKDDNPIIESKS